MTRELKILIGIVLLTFVGAYVWRDAILVDSHGNSLQELQRCPKCGCPSFRETDGVARCLKCGNPRNVTVVIP